MIGNNQHNTRTRSCSTIPNKNNNESDNETNIAFGQCIIEISRLLVAYRWRDEQNVDMPIRLIVKNFGN